MSEQQGETYKSLIDAAHDEQRQALDAGRGDETMTLFQHWSATAGWLASRKRAVERVGEPDWPDAMRSEPDSTAVCVCGHNAWTCHAGVMPDDPKGCDDCSCTRDEREAEASTAALATASSTDGEATP